INRVLIIKGLDNSKTYNLEIFASRKGVSNNTTRFTIGSVIKDVVTDNNLANEVSFTSITPTSGQIIVNIARLNAFNYVNGFILTENNQVSPSTEQLSEITEVKPTKPSVNIFPNPIKDRIVLQVNNEYKGQVTVQVINMNGIVLKQFNVVKNQVGFSEHNLSIGNLQSGNYIIRIQGDGWIEHKKVVKL
ncbi:MAG: T9SS type A sorting domain-containing protein, partial [Flavisolibacter sp.]